MIDRIAEFYRARELPLVLLDIRRSLRGVKPFIGMGIYATLMCGIALAVMYYHSQIMAPGQIRDTSIIGAVIFGVLIVVQVVMVSLLIPSHTARAISSDMESGTFEVMAITPMSSFSIVNQKLLSAILQVMILALTALPAFGIAFLFGGVSPLQLLMGYVLLVLGGALYGSIGLLASALCKTTRSALWTTYLIVFVAMPMCFNPVPGMIMLLCFSGMMGSTGLGGAGFISNVMMIAGGVFTLVIILGLTVLFQYLTAKKLDALRRIKRR